MAGYEVNDAELPLPGESLMVADEAFIEETEGLDIQAGFGVDSNVAPGVNSASDHSTATYTSRDVLEDPVYAYTHAIRRSEIDLLTCDQEADLAKRVKDGMWAEVLKRLIDTTQTQPAPEELTAGLTPVIVDGKKSQNALIEANLRLVVYAVTKWYTGKGVETSDLIQEGNLGLMHAVELFDYERGFRFSVYGMWWIKKYIKQSIAKARRNTTSSLDALISDDDDTFGNTFLVDLGPEVGELVASQELDDQLVTTMLKEVLTPFEYNVLMLRHDGKTIKYIAEEFGTYTQRIREILYVVRAKLMHPSSPTRRVIETAIGGIVSVANWQPNCEGASVETMFERGAKQNQVKRICGGCVMSQMCLSDGLAQPLQVGIWGGHTVRERNRMLKDYPQLSNVARSRSSL